MTAMMSPPETEAVLFSGVWFLPLQAVCDPDLETVPGSTDQRHAVTMCVHMNALRVTDDVNRGKGCNVHQHSWINGGWFHLTVQAGGLQLCIITLPVFGICEKSWNRAPRTQFSVYLKKNGATNCFSPVRPLDLGFGEHKGGHFSTRACPISITCVLLGPLFLRGINHACFFWCSSFYLSGAQTA